MGDLHRRRVELDPLTFSSANTRRTPGLHLTAVVHDMLTVGGVMKRYKNEDAGGFSQSELQRYQLQGYLWEDVFTRELARRMCEGAVYMRLPEVAFNPRTRHAFWVQYDERTGELLTPIPVGYIVTSPDAGVLRPDHPQLVLGEFKWTTKSAKMDPDRDKPEWFYTARGYMGALAAAIEQPVNDAEWMVMFPVGEFWGCPPIYEEWTRSYSDGEIADTWSALWEHARWRSRDANHEWSQWV